ncbi:MAG TPA: hypothetical protein VD837_14180 [Terriglobales bacterium]|nr:hypothetical protein [Terriglobales bacterium]
MDDYDRLRLSIQSALVGSVTDDLVAVTCSIECKHLTIEAYFEGAVGPYELEFVRGITREVMAGFSDKYTSESRCYSIQQREPQMLDFWAFLRAGATGHRRAATTGPRLVAS